MIEDTRPLLDRARRLADLIVGGRPVRMHFESEQQFLALLALQPQLLPVRQPVRSEHLKRD